MFIFSRVLLRRFCFVFLVRTFIRMVAFTHVCLPTSKWFLFLLCTSIRIVASTRVRLHKKMVPYSLVRFHQNVCFYLGAPALKCLHFLVCAYIFMFAFFVCIYINFTCTCVRLRQKMVPISRARLHKKYLLFLLCAYVKMFAFTRVRLH